MLCKAIRRFWIFGVLLLMPLSLAAGVNTWTGGRPGGTAGDVPSVVAADPADPYVVYGAFGGDLYRSADGGNTWILRGLFGDISALLVQPSSPSTVYVASVDFGVYKSADSGLTWSLVLEEYSKALAGTPEHPSTVFAAGFASIYRTDDEGAHWSRVSVGTTIASLVVDRHDSAIAYAAGEGFFGLGEYPGALFKTTDGGASWQDTNPKSFESVEAVAVDSSASSTVYIATGPYHATRVRGPGKALPDLLRSDDGAASWSSVAAGLPGGKALTLVADPRVPGTVYAGTESGLYWSRDHGNSWAPFSALLAGTPITSLWISDDGLRFQAAGPSGVYRLEKTRGAVDVAARRDGGSRVLATDGARHSLGTLDAAGNWIAGLPGAASETWTALAVAETEAERAYVLWQNGDGRVSLETVGPAGRVAAKSLEHPGLTASDISARADGLVHVLWTGADGRMSISSVNATGNAVRGPVYGPFAGWSAIAIADVPNGGTWALWRSTDGRAALSLHRDGEMTVVHKLGAYLDWSAADVAVGADSRPRVLRTSPSGLASVVTIDEHGSPILGGRYTLPGFTPRRIAAGSDGLTRLLFSSEDGQGEVLLLNGDNTLRSKKAVHPLASVVVTNSAELEAAMTPANAGKQILVKAGEYQVAHPLTVPDRAAVVGEGEMSFDADGLPTGIGASGRTVLRSTADLVGDVLTLGNGSSLRGLVVEDAEGRTTGNPVAVVSRAPGDFVAARIDACVIVNPNPSGVSPPGPTGRALVVVTRNPNLSQDPPQHEGAVLNVRMSRSILRSPAGAIGLFAINFASHAKIDLDLTGNVIGGGLTSSGGVSRPDAVTGSSIDVRTRGNLYRSDSADPTPVGWNLSGGSTAVIPNIVSEASTSNSLRVHSTDDRIEGFLFAISGVGGQRVIATSEPISFNSLDLNVQGTRLQSGVADLSLLGAVSFEPGVSPGDGNVLHLNMRQATGSGPRGNVYGNSSEGLGEGNRLEVAGSPNAFDHTNEGIDPRPADEFFESE